MNNVEVAKVAEVKFGQVIAQERNVLLIKRPGKGTVHDPAAVYMTIKWNKSDNGIGFHDGHYDMPLLEAVISLYDRSGRMEEVVTALSLYGV